MKIATIASIAGHTSYVFAGVLVLAALSGCATPGKETETVTLSNAVRPAYSTVGSSNMSLVSDGSGRPLASGTK